MTSVEKPTEENQKVVEELPRVPKEIEEPPMKWQEPPPWPVCHELYQKILAVTL